MYIIKNNYDINLILNYYSRQSYYNCIFDRDTMTYYKHRCEELKLKSGWFQLFNIYNNSDTLRIIIFGIKISIKMNTYKISKFIDKFIGRDK